MEHNRPDNELVSAYSLAEKPAIELETVQKAMQGDKEAFSALFMQTYRTMFLVVRRFLARDEDIYDALQNGYTKAYKYLPRLQAPEAFLTWLKRTMENAARDIRADITGRETAQEDMAEFADELTADDTEASERRADIQEVLDRLEPRQAEVLTLYYYDGMKLSEIAGLLGEPQSTVRSRFAQAKKALVEQLKVKGIDKSLYSGSVSAMIAVCLRSLIGTDVLSAATAQQMLDDIVSGRQGRLGAAAYKLLEARRNRAILKAVSLLMALTVTVSCVTVALLNGFPWKGVSVSPVGIPSAESSSEGEIQQGVLGQTTTALLPGVLPPDGSIHREPGFTIPTIPTDEEGHTLFPPVSTDKQGSQNSAASGGVPTWSPGVSSGTYPTIPGQTTTSSTGTKISTGPSASSATGSSPTNSSPPTTPTVPDGSFVPDYRPGKANTEMRNQAGRNRISLTMSYLTGNRTEKIWVDRQDEWIYVFDGTRKQIYKRRFDGTGGRIDLPAEFDDVGLSSHYTVAGDWIYYIYDDQLQRIRTDGKIKETVSSFEGERGRVYWFVIENNQVRYCSSEYISSGYGSTSYYAVREYVFPLDTEKKWMVSEKRVDYSLHNQPYSAYWLNGWLVLLRSEESIKYTVTAEHRSGNGSFVELPLLAGEIGINHGIGMPFVVGDTMYGATKKAEKYKCDFSGTPVETLYCPVNSSATGTIDHIDFIDSTGKSMAYTRKNGDGSLSFLYYSLDTGKITERPAVLYSDRQKQFYDVFEDGWIFSMKKDGTLFRCKADGSGYLEYQ